MGQETATQSDCTFVCHFITESKRKRSLDVASIFGHEVIMIREKKLVNLYAVKSGMLRFNFLLDCCQPGSLPDAHLIAALLDLVSPWELSRVGR